MTTAVSSSTQRSTGGTLKTAAYAATSARAPLAPFSIERRAHGPEGRADRDPVLRRLPLRHPPGPRRVGQLDLPDGARPRDRGPRRRGRAGGEEVQGRAISSASAAWSTRAASCATCGRGMEQFCEKGAAITYNGDRDGPQDADPGRLLDAGRGDRALRAEDPRGPRPGGRRAAAVRGHHDLLAAAPVRRQEGRPRRRRRARRAGPHGGQARRRDGGRGHRAQHLGLEGSRRATARRDGFRARRRTPPRSRSSPGNSTCCSTRSRRPTTSTSTWSCCARAARW